MSRLPNLLTSLPPLSIPQPTDTLFSFKPFPKLAPELRLKIWAYAACEPRTLLLSDNWDAPTTDPNRKAIENGNKVPDILHTSSEARQEGLKHYIACTKRNSKRSNTHTDHALKKPQSPNHKVYINFNADSFLVSMEGFYHSWWDDEEQVSLIDYQLEPQDLAKIQILDLLWDEDFNLKGTPVVVLLPVAQSLVELKLILKWVALDGPRLEIRRDDYFAYNLGGEIIMMAYEQYLRAASNNSSAWLMKLAGVQPRDEDNLLLLKKDLKLAFKRHLVLEEWDLHPVSATTAEAFAADLNVPY